MPDSLRTECSSYTDYEPLPDTPTVSIILTLYTESQVAYLDKMLPVLQDQSYSDIEIVILPENETVIRKSQTLVEALDDSRFVFEPLESVSGLSEARNIGAETATGDIVAFLDIDAVPSTVWAEKIAQPYVTEDVFAVGGRAVPGWETRTNRPFTVPPVFDWLVGSNHDSFAEQGELVRNTYGCNISFRRDVFLDLGGYDEALGKSHGYNLQGEEPNLGIELRKQFQTGVYYEPTAQITHFVNAEQQTLSWLSNRAYLQGVSKAVIESLHDDDGALTEEDDYLKYILFGAIPSYIKSGVLNLSPRYFAYAFLCLWYTGLVGVGFIKGQQINDN